MSEKSIIDHHADELAKIQVQLNSLEKYASFFDSDVKKIFNNINTQIEIIIKQEKFDDDEYKILNHTLELIQKIGAIAKENNDNEMQASVDSICDSLKKLRKAVYFLPHLAATLGDNLESAWHAKRELILQVAAFTQICPTLEECNRRQENAVVESYKKAKRANPSASFFSGKGRFEEILEKFIKNENINISEPTIDATPAPGKK